MNMQEAARLAMHIENSVAGIRVIAIGRFVDPAEIRDGMLWKISVTVDGRERPAVIGDEHDLFQIVDSMPPLSERDNGDRKPRQAQPATPGMLF